MSQVRSRVRAMSTQTKNRIFGVWFVLDGVLAMFPPLYWGVSEIHGTVFGLPFTIFYFIVTGLVITASIVALYVVEELRGEVV
jgi:hypothetical protein